MKESGDHIEELFQEAFNQFEADVSPDIWMNVKAGIQGAPAAPVQDPGVSASAVSTGAKAVVGKWIVAAVTTAVVATGGITYFNSQDTTEPIAQKQVTNSPVEKKIEETKQLEEPNQVDLTLEEPETSNLVDPVQVGESQSGQTDVNKSEVKENTSSTSQGMAPDVTVDNNNEESANNQVNNDNEPVKTNDVNAAKEEERKAIQQQMAQHMKEALINYIDAYPVGGKAPLDVTLQANTENAVRWFWELGDGAQSDGEEVSHRFEEPGSYRVTLVAISEDGSAVRKSITVEVTAPDGVQAEASLLREFPNIFTPNGDGINDFFKADQENLKAYLLTVFNAGGEIVFESSDPQQAWDGRDLNGANAPSGTYFYNAIATGEDGNKFQKRGSITLRR